MSKLIWHTEWRKVNDLVPYHKNPRKLSKEQEAQLRQSLETFNLVEIPAIDTNNRLVAGHQRVYILKSLGRGEEQIEVRVPNRPLTESEFEQYNIRSNANTGDWDYDLLMSEFDAPLLKDWGLDIGKLLHVEEKGIAEEMSAIPPLSKKEPVIKRGDLFLLGPHLLLCGDSSDTHDMKRLCEDAVMQLVFTSPPYNIGKSDYYYNGDFNDNLAGEAYVDFNLKVVETLLPYLKGFLFWNISYNKNTRSEFLDIAYRLKNTEGLRFLELIIWYKKNGLPVTSYELLSRYYENIFVYGTESAMQDIEFFLCGTTQRKAYFNKKTIGTLSNFWEITTAKGVHTENHKACYPVELPRKAIELMTLKGERVLDPFLGSGTTLIAAEQTGRICHGMELSPEYCEVIIRRWANYHQQQEKATPYISLTREEVSLAQILANG